MRDPADIVRKCFALAASTTHEGERAAALERAALICERNGLDLLEQAAACQNSPLPNRNQTDDRDHNWEAMEREFWDLWNSASAHWRAAAAPTPEELIRDPDWLERTAAAARAKTNEEAGEHW